MNPEHVENPAPLSEGQRLTGVFHSPGAVFADIARSGRWWIPVLIATCLSIALVAAMQSRVSVDQILAKAIEGNERFQQLSADQKEQALSSQRKIIPIAMFGGAALGNIGILLVMAAALMFVFNLLMDGKLRYKNALNICGYSMFPPGIVGGLVMFLVLYLKPPDEFDIQNALAFNLGAFLPTATSAWIKSLAGSIDLFTFWTIFLLAIGFARAIPKMTTGKAFGAILVPWVFWVLVKSGWAAAFG